MSGIMTTMWLVTAAAGLAADAGTEMRRPAAYTIGAGDVLDVAVFQEEDLTGQYPVGEGGTFEMPIVGTVDADGQTVRELTASLTSALGAYIRNPQVTVRIETYGSQPVRILGEINEPGTYFLTGPTTLTELLAMAGGVKSARSAQEAIIRSEEDADSAEEVINLSRLRDSGEGNVFVSGGDVIYISEGQAVYVTGEVKNPGSVPFQEGMTVTEAIALAGEALPTANLRRAYIQRGEERIPVNIRRIRKSRDPDIVMLNGDKIFIDESVF